VPAKVRVIVTRRPKYACRTCEKTGADEVAGIIQAPAPARLVDGGLPTEAFVADVVVSKYADHQPLYRQSQILARLGVKIERSTLAQWVGDEPGDSNQLCAGRRKGSTVPAYSGRPPQNSTPSRWWLFSLAICHAAQFCAL
jgi:transposase